MPTLTPSTDFSKCTRPSGKHGPLDIRQINNSGKLDVCCMTCYTRTWISPKVLSTVIDWNASK